MTISLSGWVNAVAWSPSNNFLFTAGHDGIITVVNSKDQTTVPINVKHSPANFIVPISDTLFYAVSFDRHIYQYELDSQSGAW